MGGIGHISIALQCTLEWSRPTQALVRARGLMSQMEHAMAVSPGALLHSHISLELSLPEWQPPAWQGSSG